MTNESKQEKPDEHGRDKVTVKLDNVDKTIRRGSYVVSDLKKALEVPAEKVLDQLIDNQLVELADTDRIVIKGGENFISHARGGGSA